MPPVLKIVRIERRRPLESVICVLLRAGPEVIVASEISSSLDPDGYSFFPAKDVLRIEENFDHVDFYAAAAAVWSDIALGISSFGRSETYADLMQSMAQEQSLIAVHVEIFDPDVAYVGRVRRVLSDRIGFNNLSQHGIWTPETETIKIQKITKIELSTRYLRSLEGVIAARGEKQTK